MIRCQICLKEIEEDKHINVSINHLGSLKRIDNFHIKCYKKMRIEDKERIKKEKIEEQILGERDLKERLLWGSD